MSVLNVSKSETHSFSKLVVPSITLIQHLGVEGDAHAGVAVQHRSRKHLDPPPANLRQVHLIQSEILNEVTDQSGDEPLKPGDLGENVLTTGIDLLNLSKGTKLRFVDGEDMTSDNHAAVIIVTGLRNPCYQIDKFRKGLKEKFVVRDSARAIIGRKAGVMATVEVGGEIKPGMRIVAEEPDVFEKMECV